MWPIGQLYIELGMYIMHSVRALGPVKLTTTQSAGFPFHKNVWCATLHGAAQLILCLLSNSSSAQLLSDSSQPIPVSLLLGYVIEFK